MITTTALPASDLARATAAACTQLRRSPGRRETWPNPVLRALERDRPATYARLRRRLGLIARLGTLAGLGQAERATLSLACFFRELADDPTLTERPPARAWSEYFLRHDRWLAPCFILAETLSKTDWPDDESYASVVGRMAYRYDTATLEQRRRPLQVLEELPDVVESKLEEAVALLLLSENGQELCDHHFQRKEAGYRPPAGEVIRSIDTLRPRRIAARPIAAEGVPAAPLRLPGSAMRQRAMEAEGVPAAPLRLSGSAMRSRPARPKAAASKETPAPREAPAARQAPPEQLGGTFEERRRALRSLHERAQGQNEPPSAPAPIEQAPRNGAGSADERPIRDVAPIEAVLAAIEAKDAPNTEAALDAIDANGAPETEATLEVFEANGGPDTEAPEGIETEGAPETAEERSERLAAVRAQLLGPSPIERREATRTPAPAEATETIAEAVPAEEEPMEKIRSLTAARADRESQPDFVARLEEVQLRLEQIERVAEEGRRLLAELGPELQEVAAWMADMESMISRWRPAPAPADAEERAA